MRLEHMMDFYNLFSNISTKMMRILNFFYFFVFFLELTPSILGLKNRIDAPFKTRKIQIFEETCSFLQFKRSVSIYTYLYSRWTAYLLIWRKYVAYETPSINIRFKYDKNTFWGFSFSAYFHFLKKNVSCRLFLSN